MAEWLECRYGGACRAIDDDVSSTADGRAVLDGAHSFSARRFRQSANPRADYTGVPSCRYVEIGVAVIEAVLLVAFAIPAWAARVDAFPTEAESTVVRVVTEQFAWNMHYPGADGQFGRTALELVSANNPVGLDRSDPAGRDDITTINQLNLPVNRPVIIHLLVQRRDPASAPHSDAVAGRDPAQRSCGSRPP